MSYFQIESFKFLFVFSFALGIWTALNLILMRRGDPYIRAVLIFYIVLLLGAPINTYFNLVLAQPINILTALGHKLSWIYGPLLALVVQRLLLHKISFAKLLLQFLPFIYFTTDQVLGVNALSFGHYVLLLYLQIGGYLAYVVVSGYKNWQRLRGLVTSFKGGSYYWAVHLGAGLVLIMATDLFVVTGLFTGLLNSLAFAPILACSISVYICALALLFLYQPRDDTNAQLDKQEERTVSAGTALREPELSAQVVQELTQSLQRLVATAQPHLDGEVSLRTLAANLNISPHYLSQFFNQHLGVSFYDYLNNLRHEEAIKMLRDGRHHFSITDIAYRAGFNNRNSFYRVFKEKTGLTPSQYKAALN